MVITAAGSLSFVLGIISGFDGSAIRIVPWKICYYCGFIFCKLCICFYEAVFTQLIILFIV